MMTREQLFKLGLGSRVIFNILKELNMEKHFAIAMTPRLICEIKAADRNEFYEQDHKTREASVMGVPVILLRTNGD